MALPEENDSSRKSVKGLHTEVFKSIREKEPNDENEIMLHPTLDYINRILLQEDIDEKFSGYQEVAALSDTEKPFYDILGEKYPSSPITQSVLSQSQLDHTSTTCLLKDQVASSSTSESSTKDTKVDSLLEKEFQIGVGEVMKLLPTINNLAIDMPVSRLSLDPTQKKNNKSPEYDLEEERAHGLVGRPKGRNNSNNAELDLLEGGDSTISMLCTEELTSDEMYNKALLYLGEEDAIEEISHIREIRKCEASSCSNKKENQEENIDLESLLIQCSEAVACGNRKMAEELINEIRKQASPVGNGAQRLACILADGLEARLAGTDSETYRRLANRRTSIREILKAFRMYIAALPVLRISYCFANECILKATENASKIHIIDLGIMFGFQWPPLIQALARKEGGAPKLRITGVDLPQPGFRPAERIKQTGVRLKEYAKSFGVPFEYQCIASLWESICIEDLKIEDDEVLIVNCMFRFRQVRDESFAMDSPRNRVLNLVRQIKPKVFILGIINSSFSPFFTTRFRKVMLLYSTLFDMFDAIVPRDDKGRQVSEREMLAPIIINLVACEGPDWVERPETYKQWHKRNSSAGFEQLPMDWDIVKGCNENVKSGYREGFLIEEDGGWLLLGWKGRICYALSTWKPKQ